MSEGIHAGKVALVTGASRGIGAGIATRLGADGAKVVITYARSAEGAAAVVDTIEAAGGEAFAIRADSADPAAVARSVDDAAARWGRLDILVNSAGGATFVPLEQYSLEEIEWVLDVNVRATILATQSALAHLPEGGRIINIGSINAERMPFPGGSIYSTAKGAIAGFTRGMARELGPRKITINNVQPGPVDTDGNPASGPSAEAMLGVMAVGSFGTTAEIGSFVSYLAGPDAAFITGASLTIDGGFGA